MNEATYIDLAVNNIDAAILNVELAKENGLAADVEAVLNEAREVKLKISNLIPHG